MREADPAHDASNPELTLGIEGRVSSPVLVGREHELEALVAALATAPAVAVIEGEAGVGKTRLIQELLADRRLKDHVRLLGHCPPLREPSPLAPVVEALGRAAPAIKPSRGRLTGALRSLLPELADRLPPDPPALADPRSERRRTFEAMRELLSDLGPCLFVLEDLHWADPGTLEFLRFLLTEPPKNLAVVATYRREDLTSPELPGLLARPRAGISFVRVGLRSFGPEEVRHLVSAILETDEVSDDFANYLHERTGGIPFVVEEVLWLLRNRHDLVRRDGRWVRRAFDAMSVPPMFQDWLLERVSRIGPDAELLTQAAAVLRTPADRDLLVTVAKLTPARGGRALDRCVAASLLEEEDGRYGFRHVLAREAVYAAIQEGERRDLHARAARRLERLRPRPHAQLAYHCKAAGRPADMARHAEAAARAAMRIGDDAAASHFLQEALIASDVPARTRVRLLTALGHTALHGLAHDEALPILREALDVEGLPAGTRGQLALSLGLLLIQAGDAREGFDLVAEAFPLLRRRPALAARAAGTLASPWRVGARADELPMWLERAMAAVRRQTDPGISTIALVDRAFILLCLADPEAEQAIRDVPWHAESVGERRQLIRGRLNLAQAAIHLGRYRDARAHLSAGQRLSEDLNYGRLQSALDTTEVLIDWATGRWEGLEERSRRLCEAAIDVPHAWVDGRLVIGLLRSARGETDAPAVLEETLATAMACGSLPVLAAAAAGVVTSLLEAGDAEAGRAAANEPLEILSSTGIWVWAAPLVQAVIAAEAAAGRMQEADGLLGRLRSGIRGRNAPAARAALLSGRAIIAEVSGEAGGAARAFSSAERAWARLPNPYLAARARHARGRALLHGSRPSEASEQLRSALRTFEDLGASRDAARVRRTLRSAGIRLAAGRNGGRRGYGTELSPREAEVASLVMEGKRNHEIADLLFLSRRTVEVHVASAMRKVGARSRTKLAVALLDTNKNT